MQEQAEEEERIKRQDAIDGKTAMFITFWYICGFPNFYCFIGENLDEKQDKCAP